VKTTKYEAPHDELLSSLILLSLFMPNILNTLLSNTTSLYSSLMVKDQVSDPYKTRKKVLCIVLYSFVCTFIVRRREDRFWTE